ncbi:MAG: ParA family protein [Burkholderiales bacterium]|nr:ParA family protein [Anaerolineae bacterium]
MQIITLLNEKGGVGKTTMATHIAAGLAIKGHRVVLVDADPQGHATVAMGLEKEPGFYNLLVRNARFQDVMRHVSPEWYGIPNQPVKGQLFVIPSNIETRHISESISDALRVKKRLNQLREAVDVIVFDTSPTPSLLHASIYMATDYIIYPTKCEFFSFDGLAESISHADMAQEARQEMGLSTLKMLGILPTMYRPQTVAHSESLKQLREEFGDLVWSPLRQRTAWVEATIMGQLVFSFEPDGAAAAEAWQVVSRVEKAVNGERQTQADSQ